MRQKEDSPLVELAKTKFSVKARLANQARRSSKVRICPLLHSIKLDVMGLSRNHILIGHDIGSSTWKASSACCVLKKFLGAWRVCTSGIELRERVKGWAWKLCGKAKTKEEHREEEEITTLKTKR